MENSHEEWMLHYFVQPASLKLKKYSKRVHFSPIEFTATNVIDNDNGSLGVSATLNHAWRNLCALSKAMYVCVCGLSYWQCCRGGGHTHGQLPVHIQRSIDHDL